MNRTTLVRSHILASTVKRLCAKNQIEKPLCQEIKPIFLKNNPSLVRSNTKAYHGKNSKYIQQSHTKEKQ